MLNTIELIVLAHVNNMAVESWDVISKKIHKLLKAFGLYSIHVECKSGNCLGIQQFTPFVMYN